MTIDEIRKITEENEIDRGYDFFINAYILPEAKKGLHSAKVKTIWPEHADKLKKEGYVLTCYENANNHCDEYWVIEW